jgi:hypothetical protein
VKIFICTRQKKNGKYNMSGVTASKLMRGLAAIAKTVFASHLDQETKSEEHANQIRQQNFILETRRDSFCKNLLPMWECIEKKDDFTERDIAVLHKYTANFMNQWVELCEGRHMPNYIHVLGSGHLTYFAKHYGNLYRFSQQGWESLNKLIKHFYYNNTNHGGSYGSGGKDEKGQYTKGSIRGQHCYPLMRFCQRFMMWKLGYGDTFFESMTNSVMCGAIPTREPVHVDNTIAEEDAEVMQFGII